MNTPLNNTSTNTQHVESLYSGQIQCVCTRLKKNDESLNQDDHLSKNCLRDSILHSSNLSPKFPTLPNTRGFKIAFLNICSLTCHHDELCVFMEDKTVDILGMKETKLHKTIPDCQVDIEGYDILRRDRNRNGGGVALYIRQSLNYVICDKFESYLLKHDEEDKESMSVRDTNCNLLPQTPDRNAEHLKFVVKINYV